jgi:pimeloyl-ACP methyl ester carboxylesterase
MVAQQYDTGEDPSPAESDPQGKLPAYALIWILLAGIGWLGLVLAGPFEYQRQPLQWESQAASAGQIDHPDSPGQTLRGDLWLPRQANRPLPAVILVHGVMSSRLQPELAARSLSRAGIAVLTFDLRGYGESDPGPDLPAEHRQDVLSALAFLRAQPGIDPHRISLIGHSMGATAVLEAGAEDGQLRSVFAIGMHGEGRAHWLTGLYDNLHSPSLYPPLNQKVTISPSANHQTEWNDLWLLSHLQRQLEADFGLPQGSGPWPELLRIWSGSLLAIGLLGIGSALLAPLAIYLRLGLLSALAAGFLLGSGLGWFDAGLSAIGLLLLLGAYILSQVPARRLYSLAWLGLGFFVARELAALLRALPWLLPDPGQILWLPLYLWQSLSYYPIALSHGLRSLLFSHSQTQLEASWVLMALAAGEWLFPGWWLKIGQWKPQRQGPALGLLAVALLILAGLLWTRLSQGYLEPEALQHLLRVLLGEVPTLGFLALGYWLYQKRKSAPEMT